MKSPSRIMVILVSSALIMLASPLAAKSVLGKTPQVQADTKVKFDAVAAEVRRQMVPGGRFEFLTKEEHAKVDGSLDAMAGFFDKYDAVSKMDKDTKIALFNDQEVVDSILKRRDSERLICRSEMPTGSHIPSTKCRTYGEIERGHSDTQNFLERYQQKAQPNGSSISSGTIGH